MAHWNDQAQVLSSTTLASFCLSKAISVEIERIIPDLDSVPEYRLTMGNLFASQSIRFPCTQQGMEDMLANLNQVSNNDNKVPVQVVGGQLEERKS